MIKLRLGRAFRREVDDVEYCAGREDALRCGYRCPSLRLARATYVNSFQLEDCPLIVYCARPTARDCLQNQHASMRPPLLWRFHVIRCLPSKASALIRSFAVSSHVLKNAMPQRPTLPDSELHHVYLKGSGPGGQKINKTNSACQLTHIPTGIVVKSQATRSRSQNHNIARRILAEKIELLEKGDQSRAAIKTAVASKKKASKRKKALRKYRRLEDGKEGKDDEDSEEAEDDRSPEAAEHTKNLEMQIGTKVEIPGDGSGGGKQTLLRSLKGGVA
jgi:protein subunit release factor B